MPKYTRDVLMLTVHLLIIHYMIFLKNGIYIFLSKNIVYTVANINRKLEKSVPYQCITTRCISRFAIFSRKYSSIRPKLHLFEMFNYGLLIVLRIGF